MISSKGVQLTLTYLIAIQMPTASDVTTRPHWPQTDARFADGDTPTIALEKEQVHMLSLRFPNTDSIAQRKSTQLFEVVLPCLDTTSFYTTSSARVP